MRFRHNLYQFAILTTLIYIALAVGGMDWKGILIAILFAYAILVADSRWE